MIDGTEAAGEGRQEHQGQIVGDAVAPGEYHGQDHRPRCLGESLLQRQLALFTVADRLRLVTGMGQPRAHPIGEHRKQAAADKGQPPDPGIFGVHLCQQHRTGGETRRQQIAAGRADIGEAAGDAAAVARRGLDQIGDRTGEFAADGETLEQADQKQQDRRPDTDLSVGRQKADGGCRPAHQDHRQNQNRLAADAVAEVTEHGPADRPDRKADCEAAIGANQRSDRIGRREEQHTDHRREIAVEPEIVPLEHVADHSGAKALGRQVFDLVECGDVVAFAG